MTHIAMRGFRCALAGLALVACNKASTPPGGDLLVTASVTPSVFRVRDSVTVRVVVTNRGSELRTINLSACADPFVVTTLDGVTVAPPPRFCTLEFVGHTLAPGEQYSFAEPWSGQAAVEGTPAFLASGTYLVRGRVFVDGSDNLIENPPVEIQIVP